MRDSKFEAEWRNDLLSTTCVVIARLTGMRIQAQLSLASEVAFPILRARWFTITMSSSNFKDFDLTSPLRDFSHSRARWFRHPNHASRAAVSLYRRFM